MKQLWKHKRFKYIAIPILLLLLIIPAWALLADNYTAEDHAMARDLAALSGLSEDQVLNLYSDKGDWNVITKDILVYKSLLLDHFQGSSLTQEEVNGLIKDYQAVDLLTVCQFIAKENKDIKEITTLMKDYSDGSPMEAVLEQAKETKVYKTYVPAGEEQIKKWLDGGYLPEDVLKADEIAMSKDMLIADVIKLKAADMSWDQVEAKLAYDDKTVVDKNARLTIADGGKNKQYTADNYEQMTTDVNSDANKEKQNKEAKIRGELTLSDADINKYLDMGFNIYEIKNAYELSKKSGASVDTILSERRDGADWESLIEKYSKAEGTDAS